jgi:hypothetical protein
MAFRGVVCVRRAVIVAAAGALSLGGAACGERATSGRVRATRDTWVLVGVVETPSAVGVRGARVAAEGTLTGRVESVADSQGRFALLVRDDSVRLMAGHLGFAQVAVPVRATGAESTFVRVVSEPTVLELAPVTISRGSGGGR